MTIDFSKEIEKTNVIHWNDLFSSLLYASIDSPVLVRERRPSGANEIFLHFVELHTPLSGGHASAIDYTAAELLDGTVSIRFFLYKCS